MLTEIKKGEYVTNVWYELAFDDGRNNGFAFPCDENGNVMLEDRPYARKNYEECLKHPERFVRFNKVTEHRQTYREPDEGICSCGNTVVLANQYMGACQCEKCGRWYNLFGQSLLPPEYWEE